MGWVVIVLWSALPARAADLPTSLPLMSVSTPVARPESSPEVAGELMARRVLPPGMDRYTSEDVNLLSRMKQAEEVGAIDLLQNKLGNTAGLVVEHGSAKDGRKLWLTKKGYDEYLFLWSQQAVKYFENQGTEPKFVFMLRNVKRKRLFDGHGLLTPAGDELFGQILAGNTVQWRDTGDHIVSNGK